MSKYITIKGAAIHSLFDKGDVVYLRNGRPAVVHSANMVSNYISELIVRPVPQTRLSLLNKILLRWTVWKVRKA